MDLPTTSELGRREWPNPNGEMLVSIRIPNALEHERKQLLTATDSRSAADGTT